MPRCYVENYCGMTDDYDEAIFVITREIGQLGECFPKNKKQKKKRKKVREEGKKSRI